MTVIPPLLATSLPPSLSPPPLPPSPLPPSLSPARCCSVRRGSAVSLLPSPLPPSLPPPLPPSLPSWRCCCCCARRSSISLLLFLCASISSSCNFFASCYDKEREKTEQYTRYDKRLSEEREFFYKSHTLRSQHSLSIVLVHFQLP